ncbi:MAG: 50S ribosomal protein L6 [Acidimicrobiia bacterium]
MSRIGLSPVALPAGVEVTEKNGSVTVKGPKGTLSYDLPEFVSLRQEEQQIVLERNEESRDAKAMHGLARSLVANMVVGVSEGFRKDLEIVGVGYRASAKSSSVIDLALGFSHPVSIEAPEGVTFEVPSPTNIGVIGIDKQVVGQVAADIRALRKPEPYKGKGVRYAGERVLRKAGKTAK